MFTTDLQPYGQLLATLVLFVYALSTDSADLDEGSHYSNKWVVEFKPGTTEHQVNQFARSYGLIEPRMIFEHIYEFHYPKVVKRSLEHASEHTSLLQEHYSVLSAEQQVGKVRKKRAHVPEPKVKLNDKFWERTWYLNRGINSRSSYDMNVIPAWKKGFTGKSIVVTILDDGIEKDHPDLEKNYDPLASTDINGNDDDPQPRYDYSNENRHGTRCAGEVAAEANNTKCSVGVAYDAKIGGIRMLDGSVTDSVEARSLKFNPNHVDIYSASWGPDDNGRTVDGPGKLAKRAFIDGVTKGRNGKGNIFLWASGNGGSHHDSCACDGYTNSIYTLSVSSASEKDRKPWYLEECASTLAATYSSGATGIDKQIVTTDLRKACTTSHTGTSASAPLAAGLVAVMLEANPELTWRDVQYVTMAAANPVPLIGSNTFKTNGAGRKFSHQFGYGLMDLGKMVEIADTWKKVPIQLIKCLPKVSPDANLNRGYSNKVTVPACSPHDYGCINYLEHVQLVLKMNSVRRGQLTVKLKSPRGTESVILPRRSSDTLSAGFDNWPFMSVHFWGEDPSGTWEFEIDNGKQSGKLNSYQLVIYGVSVDPFDKNRPKLPDEITCHDTCAVSSDATLACSGSGPDQCKDCREDLFKVEDTNICVEACEKGYYKSKGGNECKLCHKSCSTCSGGDINSCSSCDSKLLLDNEGHCAEQCPIGFFSDDMANLCRACRENCTDCVSLERCIDCGDGFEVVKGQCKQLCKDREYRNKEGTCVPCTDDNCVLCSDADVCLGCDVDYFLYHNHCTPECPENTFIEKAGRDSGQSECKDCHKDCKTCNEGMNNNCITCYDRYQLTSAHKCVLNTTCMDGQFRALDIGDCENCDDSCQTCHGPRSADCTSCPENFYLKDGACVKECGDGLYGYIDEDNGHTSCQHCHPSCGTCSGEQPNQCLSCSEYANFTSGSCIPICPPGQYSRHFHQDTGCLNCSSACFTCSGPRESDCTSCNSSSALAADGSCVGKCDDGYFKKDIAMEGMQANYLCHICNPVCRTCKGEFSSDCLSCQDNEVLFKGHCVRKSVCYAKQYYNSSANECLSCNSLCTDCIGPSELECTSCEEGQQLYIKPYHDSNSPVDEKEAGQCVVCCKDDDDQTADCCDCPQQGPPVCDHLREAEFSTETIHQQVSKEHKSFITLVVLGILACIGVYLVTFLILQYRSHGRCAWQSSSSTILVDGNGVIEYSALSSKAGDQDILFAADDGYSKDEGTNYTKPTFDYGSD